MLLVEMYGLRRVPEVAPLIVCSLESNLVQYGLPTALLAAALVILLFLEASVDLHGRPRRASDHVGPVRAWARNARRTDFTALEVRAGSLYKPTH